MTFKKFGLLTLGWSCMVLAVLGVVLPLLPTTPFVLVAAYAFSKSSSRFHQWLMNHKIFGPLVRDWQNGGVIGIQAKMMATLSIVLMVSLSFYLLSSSMQLVIVLSVIIMAVLAFIWSRPSSLPDKSGTK